jgi:hypothetical protein
MKPLGELQRIAERCVDLAVVLRELADGLENVGTFATRVRAEGENHER